MAQTSFLLRAANVIRDIDPLTETEVWEIGAETGMEYLKEIGLDVAEGVTKDIEDVAATTACLFSDSSMERRTSQRPVTVVAATTNCQRRRMTRMSCHLPNDAIRWRGICMRRDCK